MKKLRIYKFYELWQTEYGNEYIPIYFADTDPNKTTNIEGYTCNNVKELERMIVPEFGEVIEIKTKRLFTSESKLPSNLINIWLEHEQQLEIIASLQMEEQ
jgi:hypothetical protein